VTATSPEDPRRTLSMRNGAALVVANMVGTGVFTTTGLTLGSLHAPLAVLAVWVLSGVLALAGAAVYAELGAMMPEVGGEYLYLSRGLHPLAGFLSGWVGVVVGFMAPTAAAAIAFGRYLHAAVPGVPATPAAVAIVLVASAAHLVDVRVGARLQTALTMFVVLVIVGFVLAGLASGRGHLDNLTTILPGATAGPAAYAVALVYVGYAYIGWNAAAYVGGEIRDPERNLPRALLLGTALVTALYLALNVVFLWSAPPAALAGEVEVAHTSARALFGATGATVASSLIAASLAGTVGGMMMIGPRVALAMARDGVMFRALGRLNSRGAPTAAVAVQGLVAAVGAATAGLDRLLIYAGFTLTLSAAGTVVVALRLRRLQPDARRPHRAFAWPASAIVFLLLAGYMTVLSIWERPRESAAGIGTLVVGAALYPFTTRRARKTG
jgi:APA family basic amino acid/polyamine antiporter